MNKPSEALQRLDVAELAKFDFFSSFTQEEIAQIVSCAEHKSCAENTVIFKEGDAGTDFFTILEGEVLIRREISGYELARLKSGQIFGEMTVLDRQVRSATALAASRVELLVLNGQHLLEKCPNLSIKLFWYLARELSMRLRETDILIDRDCLRSDYYLDVVGVVKKYGKTVKVFDFFKSNGSSHFTVLDNINLYIHRDNILGLIGESGCGKTTLARAILKLIDVDAGKIFIDGTDISLLSDREMRMLRRKIQIIFQNPFTSLSPHMTVRKIVEEPIRLRNEGTGEKFDPELVKHFLRQVNFNLRKLDDYPHQLSGGERRRVGVARILAVKPQFIVADEPVASLDASIKAQITNLLLKLKEQEKLTFLIISHDIGMISYCSDAIAVMYLGNIVEKFRNSEQNLNRVLHPYTEELLIASRKCHGFKKLDTKLEGGDYDFSAHDRNISGCKFHPRCQVYRKLNEVQQRRCKHENPKLQTVSTHHLVACHFCQ